MNVIENYSESSEEEERKQTPSSVQDIRVINTNQRGSSIKDKSSFQYSDNSIQEIRVLRAGNDGQSINTPSKNSQQMHLNVNSAAKKFKSSEN